RSPLSTLFPYTTLFRSLFLVADHQRRGRRVELRLGQFLEMVDGGDVLLLRLLHVVECGGAKDGVVELADADGRPGDGGDAEEDGDRKSTRLNSSHVKIS